ncbi:MAG TPA: A24 family peptidase [Ilumatobacter sp.]|nr:A24 family peptidase [Ilumatobacter sp.]
MNREQLNGRRINDRFGERQLESAELKVRRVIGVQSPAVGVPGGTHWSSDYPRWFNAQRVVPASAVLGAGLGLAAWALASGWLFAVAVVMPAAIAASVDLRSRRLPDWLVGLAATPTLAAMVAETITVSADALAAVLLGSLAMGLAIFVTHAIAPDSIGFGDVKLALVLGAALGTWAPALGLVALAVASATAIVEALVRRRTAIAFGPGLVIGFAVTAMFPEVLARLVGGMTAGWSRW